MFSTNRIFLSNDHHNAPLAFCSVWRLQYVARRCQPPGSLRCKNEKKKEFFPDERARAVDLFFDYWVRECVLERNRQWFPWIFSLESLSMSPQMTVSDNNSQAPFVTRFSLPALRLPVLQNSLHFTNHIKTTMLPLKTGLNDYNPQMGRR